MNLIKGFFFFIFFRFEFVSSLAEEGEQFRGTSDDQIVAAVVVVVVVAAQLVNGILCCATPEV